MYFLESEAVNVLIHVKVRQLYPDIKFHEETLSQIATCFNFRSTFQIHILSDLQLQEVADALLQALPREYCASNYKNAV